MKKILAQLNRIRKQIRGLFPEPLPTGMAAANDFAQSIMDTYTLPTLDQDSVKYAIATMIMRLGPTDASKSKYYFVLSVRAACAKQIAGAVFQDIKLKQQAVQQLADDEAKKQAEVTASTAVADAKA